jgi:titin
VPGSLSLVVPTTLNDASISDFDSDYPFAPHSWYTITPNTALPNIASDVILDATTQPGYAGTPIIELDGSSVGSNVSGLSLTGDNSTVRGLVINGFTGHGLVLSRDVSSIESNYIGTDVSGTIALGNGKQGIQIDNSASHIIGGLTPGAGNVISGNTWSGVSIQLGGSSDNVVQGNLIGTDATGTVAIGNGIYGVDIWNGGPSGNLIGGSTPGAGNVISGNAWECVQIRGSGATNNTVSGNYMGTDASGMFPIPCGLGGIVVEAGARNNTIGGAIPGAGNLIAFNNGDGVCGP